MQFEREAIVEMLVAIGYKNAVKYDDAKLVERLEKLADKVPDEVPEEYQDLLDRVVAADSFEFAGDEESDDDLVPIDKASKPAKAASKAKAGKDAKKAKSKASEAAKPAKKADKPAKAKKEPVVRDEFGAREGTGTSKINAVLSKKPKTVKMIVAESGVEPVSRVRSHLYSLTKAGILVNGENGYSLANGEAKPAKASSKTAKPEKKKVKAGK